MPQEDARTGASLQNEGNSNRGRKPDLPGTGLVERITGREPPPREEAAPLVDETGASDTAKNSNSGTKQSLASKWFGKSSANKNETNPNPPTGIPVSEANGNGVRGSGDEPGFWSRAKGFIKKKIGKRGEDDSDSDEERRVRRRQPIDDSGWGSDEDDVSGDPGGSRRLWRISSRRRSSRKSVSGRRASRASRRSSTGGELTSQSRRLSASGAQAGGAVANPAAVHAIETGSVRGGSRRVTEEANGQGISGAVSPKALGEESGTPVSPTRTARDATRLLETDPVLYSVKAQVDFGLGLLQVLVSLIPTKVSG